ncbi:MAG: ERCC4 domain-containing protein [Candidatus Methanoperedens sp.]|nr:ERCC4 domain-containing protein [Candidatus Methanoperedens sp.]
MKIVIDHREKRAGVIEELKMLGAEIEFSTLQVADYVVSDRVAFERKTVDDLFATMFERRELFSQLMDLSRSYRLPILIMEGEDPFFYSKRKVNPMAIQGFLNTIALMRIPTLYTLNAAETAQAIFMIAQKEQDRRKKPFNLHGKRSHLSQSELKEYVVSSIPGIGPVVAGNLLVHFGSVEKIMTAKREELIKVDRVGSGIADKIRKLAADQL